MTRIARRQERTRSRDDYAAAFHEMLKSNLKMWAKLISDAKISVDVLP